ncbi:DNA polymerase I [Arthrobacter psychrolactophilus]|uniref:DNA polymerase I n=2 Tax=Arthrobacter psychrolactophilus TaxID=92442 RepID=A0A2V5IPH2_9MICC|nr:DNA polymerase I [Arthrobacter psychrolactophilus]PYI38498.1 DNA polymerase I [Arthrobacter psychrolactophilus]
MMTRLALVSESAKTAPQSSASPSPLASPVFGLQEGATPRLLVLDGHSMAFRAFYAMPVDKFVTQAGQYTNAVHGFTAMLLTMIRQQKPTHVVVAFDLDTPTFRSLDYTEYKGGRNKTPEEFYGQIDLIIKVMEAMRIPTISVDGFEADDIIATLSTQGETAGWDVVVVSGDRDAFQLITDKVSVLYPKKGISDIPPMDAAAVEAKYFVSPARYSDLAALVGETADNLPGVPGVGPKTAAKWINLYGGLEGIFENIDAIGGKVGDSLRAHIEDVKRNRRLNHLLRDMELPVALEDTVLQSPDRDAVEELFDALEFNQLRKRLFDLFGEEEALDAGATHEVPAHQLVSDAAALNAWVEATTGLVAVDVVSEKVGLAHEATAVALVGQESAVVVDLGTADAALDSALAAWLLSDAPKVVHEYKEALKALSVRGLSLGGVVDDTSLSGYLIQPDRRSYELAELSQVHLKVSFEAEATADAGQLDLGLESEKKYDEAVQRGYVALLLSEYFAPLLQERSAAVLLRELELPLAAILARMELTGIDVSQERLAVLLDDFTTAMNAAKEAAYAAIGHEVNLGSPKQLQEVLFEELALPKTKKIKTGFTTDAASLKWLLEKTGHEFLAQLMAHREASKLKQMVETLKKSLAEDGRIHTTYAQNVAATGRLSSNNPNLQNIPIRTEEGRRVRDIFVVSEGYECLLAADYSQIEMRIMAHLSGDAGLIQAYAEGEDLHRYVGSHVFGVAPEDVTSAMRSKVKAMSYGLAYGLTSFGLSKQLEISVDEARTLVKDYFDRFGGVRDYLRGVVEQARKDGFTSTIEGRRRYLPDLSSSDRQLRELAERIALNSPIQGSAADIIKHAMLGVAAQLQAQELKSRMLLQVHDELILEIWPGELETVKALVIAQMGAAADLLVPLEVQVGVGSSWNDAGH